MQRSRLAVIIGAAALAWALPLSALAQAYPSKPVRLIVPFAPGGTTDIVARIVSEKMGAALGQTVVVENKAGGGGSIGALEMIKAAPTATCWAWPRCPPRPPTRPSTPRSATTRRSTSRPSSTSRHAQRDRGAPRFPARDYKGFIAELKKNPGKYSYSSSGTGGIGHLQTELFKSLAGVFMTHIPYRGAGPALNDTVAGQVQIIFDNMPSALPFIKDNRLIPIVVAAPQRLAQLPNVPTFKEVGPGARQPHGLLRHAGAPRALPKEVVDKVAAR
jgi:tripartite-type tricarboxylate transporter receptor subunit TctC